MSDSDAARSRTERFTVMLSAEESARLTHRSRVSGLTRSDVVRCAIREWPLPAESDETTSVTDFLSETDVSPEAPLDLLLKEKPPAEQAWIRSALDRKTKTER